MPGCLNLPLIIRQLLATDTAQLKPDKNSSATSNANIGNLHGHGQRRGCRGHVRGRRRRGHGTRGGIRGCECGGC